MRALLAVLTLLTATPALADDPMQPYLDKMAAAFACDEPGMFRAATNQAERRARIYEGETSFTSLDVMRLEKLLRSGLVPAPAMTADDCTLLRLVPG